MPHTLSKNHYDTKKCLPVVEKLKELSYSDIHSIFIMACKICEGNYHRDYISFYMGVVEELRIELDRRIQGNLFKVPDVPL